MSIRSNLGAGVVNVTVVDTILFEPDVSIDRYHISACNVYNTTVSTLTLSVYVSPDLTSASGNLVDVVTIGSGSEVDINAIIGQGYEQQNIIVQGSALGLNASLTRTEYSGGD